MLKPLCSSIVIFKTLDDVDISAVVAGATLLSVNELGKPVFKDMTSAEFTDHYSRQRRP